MAPLQPPRSTPLSPEDLSFWYADQPRQRTTMALLMLLDRAPSPARLRAAAARAVDAVPRLRQRVVDAPLGLALPRWQDDPTFDLDFHVRRYSLPARETGEEDGADPEAAGELADLFRAVGPIYERPFDRTRPLWDLVELDHSHGSAIFFRLHHAVADGVGGNTILAALTDADRNGAPLPPPPDKPPGAWAKQGIADPLLRALRDRAGQDLERGRALLGALLAGLRRPESVREAARLVGALGRDLTWRSQSPLRSFGRARHLSGLTLDLDPLREARRQLGGRMIDVLLTAVAGAAGQWHRAHGMAQVSELLTLVPINLRPHEQQGMEAGLGNRATGILVPLPIRMRSPLRRFREVRRRVEERKKHPAAEFFPVVAGVLAALPRPLYRRLAYASSQQVDLIVTNVPGVPVPRFVAGAEITATYPFAPVAPHCPVSVALYGYRGCLYVGLDADGAAMRDVDDFRNMLERSFAEVVEAARGPRSQRRRR